MNKENIHILIERYWNCETTVREEKELRDYFSQTDLPEEFRQYLPLFTYIGDEQEVKLSDGFNKRLKDSMKAADTRKYVTIRIFAPIFRIAASLLLIGGLAISFFFITRQQNKPYYSETTDNTNNAMQQATYALEKLSDALQMSEEASMETIRSIDNFNIDWTTLDSLSNITAEDSLNVNSFTINKEENI
ncbi:MAG: hypothetical protein ITG04_04935 [Proteiniphilum sp.]|jgi:hypothetical protein|nr:hypothetical protein [Proteiniphilum sp.]